VKGRKIVNKNKDLNSFSHVKLNAKGKGLCMPHSVMQAHSWLIDMLPLVV